jgi:hypothetical protein
MSGLADYPGFDTGELPPGYNPGYFGFPVYISITAPELPQKGMLWFNPEIKLLQIYNPPGGWEAASPGSGLPPSLIAPVNTTPPIISGTPWIGNTLTLDDVGVWTGHPAQSSMIFTPQWMIDGVAVADAVGPTFVIPVGTPLNSKISCGVTAYNGLNSVNPGVSNELGPVDYVHTSPSVGAVVLSGIPSVDSELRVSLDALAGYPAPIVNYQWNGISGLDHGSTYRVLPGDLGNSISVTVYLTNSLDTIEVTSNVIGPIVPASVAPTVDTIYISGNPVVGQTLIAVVEGVTGYPPPNLAYMWSGISGVANGNQYVPLVSDAGNMIGCSVIASNSVGASPQRIAAPVGPIEVPAELEPPRNIALPAISGFAVVGSSLVSTSGTWNSFTTPVYTRKWMRDGVIIPGATSTTYVVQAADIGAVITVEVTASNANGSAAVQSLGTSAVIAQVAPTNTVPPVISGEAVIGQTLTVTSPGTWSGQPPQAAMTFSYQWLRDGSNIDGATGASYIISNADSAKPLSCRVTASNGLTASVDSNSLGPVSKAPVMTVAPVITGTVAIGQTLTCSSGSWSAFPVPTYSYQWYVDNVPVSGQVGPTYTVVFADAGKSIKCDVQASNGISPPGMATSAVVGPVPAILVAPVLSWSGNAADMTPDFTANLTDPVVGDSLTLQIFSDAGLTVLVDSMTNTLDSSEMAASLANFTLISIAPGSYHARVLSERIGWTSAFSNVVPFTLNSASSARQLVEAWDAGLGGFAINFEDGSMYVKDLTTPANNFDGLYANNANLVRVGNVDPVADGPLFNNTNYASIPSSKIPWSVTEGTLFVDFVPGLVTNAIRFAINCADASANNQAWIGQASSNALATGNKQIACSTAATAVQSLFDFGVVSATRAKIAIAIKAGDFNAAKNGVLGTLDDAGNPPALSTNRNFWIGSRNGSFSLDGKITRVLYVPRRIPDASLPALTT